VTTLVAAASCGLALGNPDGSSAGVYARATDASGVASGQRVPVNESTPAASTQPDVAGAWPTAGFAVSLTNDNYDVSAGQHPTSTCANTTPQARSDRPGQGQYADNNTQCPTGHRPPGSDTTWWCGRQRQRWQQQRRLPAAVRHRIGVGRQANPELGGLQR